MVAGRVRERSCGGIVCLTPAGDDGLRVDLLRHELLRLAQ